MASLTYMQILRGNPSFRRLWVGQVVSELGNWFNFIAVLGLVRSVSGGAPGVTALVVVAKFAPFAIFAPFAGVFVDRWSRRTVMLASDVGRSIVAFGFLLVGGPEDLWIAYSCTVLSGLFTAFFEGAKNAAMPNVVGRDGLLGANALMFSSRFLLMSVGAALGGAVSARFGYRVAFLVDGLSFLVSAYSIWLIPASEMRRRDDERADAPEAEHEQRASFWTDIREGWKFIARHSLVAAIIGVNIMWATGGGAGNLVYDRLGGVVFAGQGGLKGDAGVALIYAVVGAGLFMGILLARRVGAHLELHNATIRFIGWTLIAHGIFFALAGLMPSLWLAALMLFMSRFIIGMEFTVQETLLMRQLPDHLRGRVLNTDRAAEVAVLSVSTMIAGWSLNHISPRALTIVSGLLSASPGLIWLVLFAWGKLRMPPPPAREESPREKRDDAEEALLASAG
jgi:MFS family permease